MTGSRRYLIYATLTTLTPLLVAISLLWLTQQATFFDYVPTFSDATYHWHQPASFARVGFAAGYYTTDEMIPLHPSHPIMRGRSPSLSLMAALAGSWAGHYTAASFSIFCSLRCP